MEQRITRAKRRIAAAGRPVRDAGRGGARRTPRRRRGDGLPAVQRRLFGERRRRPLRAPLCEEAIRLARLLLRLFPGEPEIMGLTALMLLQHARAAARFDAEGAIVLLEEQDRTPLEPRADRRRAGADRQGDAPSPPGPYQVQAAIAALHARAARPRRHRLGGDRRSSTPRWSGCSRRRWLPSIARWRSPRCDGAGSGARHDRAAGAAALAATSTSSACKGGLLLQLGRDAEARVAFTRAIALANTAAEAAHIRQHLDRLASDGAGSSGPALS